MLLSVASRQALFIAVGTLVAAIAAAAMVLSLSLGHFKVIAGLLTFLILLVSLVVSGNIRLLCLWGMILTAPLAYDKSFFVRTHMGGAGAIKLEAMDVFLIPLLVFLIRDFFVGYRRNFRIPPVIYWWLGLALLGVFTVVTGPMRTVAMLEVFRMIKLTLLFVVIVNEVVRVRQFGHFVAAMMTSMAIQSTVGLIQYVFDVNLGAQIFGEVTVEQTEYTSRATYLGGEFTNRVGALIGHPNLLAIFLAMTLPIGLAVIFSNIKPYLKFGILIIVSLGISNLIFTLSRSGWIAFGVAVATLMMISFILPDYRRKYILERVVTIIAVIFVAAALSGPIMKRIYRSDEGAVDFRWEWMDVAIDMAKDKPVLGFGLNSFVWFMPPYTRFLTYQAVIEYYGGEMNLPVVHNIYLLVLVEQGIVGLFLYMGFYIHLMLIAIRGLKTYRQSFLAMVNLGCLAALIALALDGLASFFIRNDNCGRVFFIVAALIVAIQWWHRDNRIPALPASQPSG